MHALNALSGYFVNEDAS